MRVADRNVTAITIAFLAAVGAGPGLLALRAADAPQARRFDVRVASDGTGDFKTVQEAINAGKDGSVIVQQVKTLKLGEGYDAARDEFGNMMSKGIIDPLKVTRAALENAISIAGMVLTTNCLVTDLPEKNAAPGMPAGAPPMY